MRVDRPDRVYYAPEVYRQLALPVFAVEVLHGAKPDDPGHVDQYVDSAGAREREGVGQVVAQVIADFF